MLQDRDIAWTRKRKVYGPLDLNGLITVAIAEGGASSFAEGKVLQNPVAASKTAPDVYQQEVSTFGLVGLGFSAAGSFITGFIPVPQDLDPRYKVGFRVNWTSTGASGNATFLTSVKSIKKGVAIANAATTTDDLNTAHGASTQTGANHNVWTARGIKNTLGLSRTDIENGALLSLRLELDAVTTLGATSVTFLGLEMDYVPIKTVGSGSEIDRPLSSDIKNY